MTPIKLIVALAIVLCATAPAFGQAKLKELDPAPSLVIAKWVKGQPVTSFDKDKTYVVEFWATWCGPCKVSIPHLTEMAKKYKDKITFVGVDCWEHPSSATDTSYFDKVAKFVADMGDKMDYNVAIDGPEGTMAKTWMMAAGQNGIPTAFVIKNNQIQWIGHPMAMEPVLDPVLAGTFDAKKAAAERQKRVAEQEAFAKVFAPINAAYAKRDWPGCIAEIDKAMAAHPDMAKDLTSAKFTILRMSDEKAMYAFARKMADTTYKDDMATLNQWAWMMVDDQAPLKTRDYATAIHLAERAVKLSKNTDPNILDTLGTAYFKNGNIKKAIEIETKAVELLDKPGVTVADADKQSLRDRLEKFKSADH